ncbi:MAG: DUF951 family protein, partial [Staphylococcus lugdunensis]|nr:DUF951 family protein [Staphylococcus lugdunensis]
KCEKCNRSIMIPRQSFNKKMKKIVVSQQDTESKENE